ncbi:aminoglycoside 6'-N-acetyltransferase [Leptolyngbya sp. NIES-2104]|uniref:aminoglycoside 6'-N-acetyltransferase n=1 Tax=Leptolyngbya sp. NIES-2104 TaxID=1552121 RepID=UPI0006EC47A5|nr:aminoglycoside 6'-N-acetyltransferase [Leptolyngbya sp. NIES-2104]GAP96611.1 aminoglycoside 6'-N-acetyltransferase [Leptolyngbya sp. NIES-2104]
MTPDDFQEWLSLALELWSDYSSAEMEVSLTDILHSDREQGVLVRDDRGCAIAFMNLSLRSDYVPDATKSPVAYVEGLYVKAEYRNQEVGRTLIQYAEQWAREQGCIELALDALLDNPASHEFYAKVGFREVERVVFFIKSVVAGDHVPKEN